mmetsp:Transcript_29785/g.88445  ORF Transcript_29785/g.88445 Transcript_29785/m.88445 type:complete len:84 (-) Transcript_29785:934-1185(-)
MARMMAFALVGLLAGVAMAFGLVALLARFHIGSHWSNPIISSPAKAVCANATILLAVIVRKSPDCIGVCESQVCGPLSEVIDV